MGLSPGNWIAIVVAALGSIGTGASVAMVYGSNVNQLENNTRVNKEQDVKIEKIEKKIEDNHRELQMQISTSEGRTRSDIKELRDLIIKRMR